jgi:DMSO/TMAO reductase YedYZ molybdopterin-dependent catalytic subunit
MNFNRREWIRLLAAAGVAPLVPGAPAEWAPADKKKTGMIVRSSRPESLEMMIDGFEQEITPIERFFVRSHHYTPKVQLNNWKLQITGEVSKPAALTFEELRKLPRVEHVAVLECAGNGRGFYEPSMPGLQWEWGGVGNAKWAGARLADVLKLAGASTEAREVVFDGADVPVGTMPEFVRSIPLRKAMNPDTILAYEMNGEPLPTSHGFPLRLVVPGWAGDCWVKWVTKIDVSNKEFDGFFMKTAYRHPGKPVRPGMAVDPAKMEPVTALRPKSVISFPLHGQQVEVNKPLTIRGVAWTGNGERVTQGQISTDGGSTWSNIRPSSGDTQYGWRRWDYSFTPVEEAYYRILVRVGDGSGLQPLVPSWNPSGYNWNVAHMVGIEAVAAPKPVEAAAPAPPDKRQLPTNYKNACLTCHEEDVIVPQRLTRGQWDREVDKMIRWGAPVKPTDKDAIVDYLAKEFPYRMRK